MLFLNLALWQLAALAAFGQLQIQQVCSHNQKGGDSDGNRFDEGTGQLSQTGTTRQRDRTRRMA
jgi:hypothetical protein